MRTFGGCLLALAAPALAGCFSMGSSSPSEAPVTVGAGVREDTRMTQVVLDQLCLAFGERYLIAVGNGCNQIERAEKDPEPKARAHSFKLQAASSVYDILSGPNPFAKLMDLILLAELQHLVWGTEGAAARVFGADHAAPLVDALARGRADVWEVALQVLKPEQKTVLEEMIREWRAKNPAGDAIAFVRFSDFSAYRGKSILDGVPLGSGLLAPVSEAMRQIEETRMLAERGLFLAKRMPLLARWHAESYLNTVLLNPEIRKVTDSVQRAVAVAESLPSTVAKEREAILKTLDEREKSLGGIAKDVRATAADVKDIVKEAQTLLKESKDVIQAAEGFVTKIMPPPAPATAAPKDAHAFDIREYTETIKDGVKGLQEMRALLESSAWTLRVSEVNRTAQDRITHASDETRRIVDFIAWRGGGLIVLAFGLALVYRLALRKINRPAAT